MLRVNARAHSWRPRVGGLADPDTKEHGLGLRLAGGQARVSPTPAVGILGGLGETPSVHLLMRVVTRAA